MTARPLRSLVVDALLVQGPWVQRAALNGLTTCQPALDDVLADLVIDGHAEFKRHVGYRLCGGPLVRAARLQLRANPSLVRAVASAEMQTDNGPQIVVGVAERRAGLGGGLNGEVVTYQMALPPCGSQRELLALAQALVGTFKTGLLAGLGGHGNA